MPRYVCKTFVHVADPHPQSPAMLAAMRHWYQYELCAEPRWAGKLNWRNDILMSLYKSNASLTCAYCGKTDLQPFARHASSHLLTFDHIIPKAEGGQDHVENLALACHPCNSRKGHEILSDDALEDIVTIFQLLYATVKTKKEIAREDYERGKLGISKRKLRKAEASWVRRALKANKFNLWDILCGD